MVASHNLNFNSQTGNGSGSGGQANNAASKRLMKNQLAASGRNHTQNLPASQTTAYGPQEDANLYYDGRQQMTQQLKFTTPGGSSLTVAGVYPGLHGTTVAGSSDQSKTFSAYNNTGSAAVGLN